MFLELAGLIAVGVTLINIIVPDEGPVRKPPHYNEIQEDGFYPQYEDQIDTDYDDNGR